MTTKSSIWEKYRRNPYRNIFVALIAVFLVDALLPNESARGRFADLSLVVLLLAALVETVRVRNHARAALMIGVPAIGLRIVGAYLPDSEARNTAVLAVTFIFLVFLIWNLLRDLSRSDRATGERIFGALCAYMFIGLLFALVFAHMEYRDPGAFAISDALLAEHGSEEANLYPVFTYYSFVTLTTLGYGDITPVAEHARTLAWLEALLGQLYLAVMVAGFVAAHITERMQQKRPPRAEGEEGP
jgi:hypothetical protein